MRSVDLSRRRGEVTRHITTDSGLVQHGLSAAVPRRTSCNEVSPEKSEFGTATNGDPGRVAGADVPIGPLRS